ncbi:hypothetical protein Leryth_027421 [Lithospermum erythrorhizon]|nr:hypothetical protein Leryth_027421 [Lithospermum erythrorhizon]
MSFETMVNGIRINVNSKSLSSAFDIPDVGDPVYVTASGYASCVTTVRSKDIYLMLLSSLFLLESKLLGEYENKEFSNLVSVDTLKKWHLG